MIDMAGRLLERTAVLLRVSLTRAEDLGEQALQPLGVSGREYGLLALLAYDDEPPSQGRLGAALGLDRTTTTKVVAGLVARGLIDRATAPHDRRTYRLALSPAGRALFAEADQVLADCDTALTAGRLTPQETATLRSLLHRLC